MGSLLHLWCNIPRKTYRKPTSTRQAEVRLGLPSPPPPTRLFWCPSVHCLPPALLKVQHHPSSDHSFFGLLWRCSARFTDGRRNHEKGFNHALQIHWRPQGTYPAASLWLKFYLSSGFFSALLSFLKKHQKTAWPRMGFRGALQGSDSLLALFLWLFSCCFALCSNSLF